MHREIIKLIFIFLIFQISSSENFSPVYPEQIHLSFGEALHDIVVTWITFTDTKDAFVWYGEISQGLRSRIRGSIKKFVDIETSIKVRFVHKVVLRNLKPLTYYVYRCGSWYGVSQPFVFKVSPEDTNWSPRLIVFGDMGWKGAAAFPYIKKEASTYKIDAIVHVGDIAYNMESLEGFIGDQFMRMIQPVASCIPYMTTVGNHEQSGNFSFYKNIFSMPGESEGLFYSFDMGPAHFVAISTEVYYFTNYGFKPLKNQFKWLEEDLRVSFSLEESKKYYPKSTSTFIASKEKNRKIRPWIIVFGHRPMYCSSDDGEDCSLDSSVLRCSVFKSKDYGLENLFHKNKVDLIFSGHMHYYERSWPIYDRQVFNGSCEEPYRNPGAAVHIITGAAGMICGTESASYIRDDWFAFFSNEHSYSILNIVNNTHIYLEQVSATRGGEVIDSMWLIKT